MAKKRNNYRIKERLTHSFLIASAIPAAVSVVVLAVLIIVAVIYAGVLKNYGFAQGDVGKTMTYFSETRSSLRGCIGYDDLDAVGSMHNAHEEYVEMFTRSFADLEKFMITQENKDIYRNISAKLAGYWELEREILDLGAVSDIEQSKVAQSRAMAELMPLYDDIYDQLASIMDVKVDRGNDISTVMMVVCVLLVAAIAVTIILAITFSLRLGKNIAVGISEPLVQLGNRLESFAKGDLYSPFPETDSQDEVAEMIASAREMAGSLDFIISDIEHILGEMANSDFTVSSKDGSRYIGDFKQLYGSLKQLKYRMIETLRFIEESSVQVTEGSGNLAETAVSLAEGATEQAGAVEELQATITTIADAALTGTYTVNGKTAASAREAYQQSQKYADVADESSADMREMVEAMNRISEASKKIGNIISEIESIASQTNLLSLNASIEAARAGEAGRGFSVVADQIRQLAEQSSKSAVDTRALIEGTMQEVENGNRVAGRAVESIQTVVEGIRTVADSSREVSVISENQAATMKEAEIGVNQISDVIQTNAALAEESSATSEELSAQASTLDSLIAKFKLPAAK